MQRPRRHDHDAILDRWADGRTAAEIAAEITVPEKAVGSAVARARKAGDPRAVRRVARHAAVILRLEGELARRLRAEARARRTDARALGLQVLEATTTDGLFAALLD